MSRAYYFILFALILKVSTTFAESPSLSAKIEGNPKGPVYFFIHGSPGSAESFADYFNDEELKKNAQLVAIDRPGYGDTKALSKLSLDEQAKLFSRYIAQNFPNREVILVGHSYGAPVAAQMASQSEANYKSLVLMSPIADPKEVKKDVVIKGMKVVKSSSPAVPEKYQHILTSPSELARLEKDLEQMSGSWGKIRTKMIVINGEKDKRVSSKNLDYISARTQNNRPEIVIIPDEGHSLPASGNTEIKDILRRESGVKAFTTPIHVSKKRCETLYSQIFKASAP